MKVLNSTILLALIFLLISQQAMALANTAKVTLFVVDEEGSAIAQAKTSIAFEKKSKTGPGVDVFQIEGYTDANGKFSASHSNDSDFISYGTEKYGYYNSSYEYRFKNKNFIGWQPWNPELKVVLRKIESPIPMYGRKVKIDLPFLDEDIGYDLVAFDFVFPYGSGSYSDIIFNASKKIEDNKNYKAKLKISFSNKYDGIQKFKENLFYGSELKLPKIAPSNGYSKKLDISKSRDLKDGVKINFYEDDNYIFRIRSEEKDNKFVKAMYGKILGPISLGNITRRDTATITFKFYLNPDYTRNLEYDPKRNLFGVLPLLERVGIQ